MNVSSPRTQFSPYPTRGLTIIEVLIVVAVAAALLAIALPALFVARNRAQQTTCLAQQRQQHCVIEMYATASRDLLPYSLTPDGRHPLNGSQIDLSSPYAVNGYGLAAVHPWQAIRLALGEQAVSALLCPSDSVSPARQRSKTASGSEPPWIKDGDVSSYWLTQAAFLDPASLDPAQPRWGSRSMVVQRMSSVQDPARKALLFDTNPYHDRHAMAAHPRLQSSPRRVNVAAFDGSSVERQTGECVPAVVFAPYNRTDLQESTASIFVFQFTPFGVHGRDW